MSTGLVYGINQNPKYITIALLFLVNKPNKKIIIIDLI